MLAQYASIVPDAGERFFLYMEREQSSRHANQALVLRQVSLAQWFTFILAIVALLAAGACALAGEAAGLAIAAAGVLPLVQAVYQRHKQDKQERELQQKQQEQLSDGQ